jgi:peptidoglycan hydrolase CwlO-like protein
MILIRVLPLLLGALTVAGCATSQTPANNTPGSGYQWAQDAPEPDAGAKRFQDTPLGGRTAVESAVELSQKYAQLSDQAASLREENQRLKTENEKLNQQVTNLDAKLAQTQKELGEANDLLIQTLAELNAWKNNILGFRSEMRDAAKAELEALLKVLEILGGQVEARALERKYVAALDPGSAAAAEPNEASVMPSGDSNDAQ